MGDPLSCEFCSCGNVHLGGVLIEMGNTSVSCEGDSARLIASDSKILRRGSRITTKYWCESGCEWEVIQQFHKGTVYQQTVLKSQEQKAFDELWRD